jgi:uncharacterized protein YdcH (DUF465 family)
MEQNAQEDVKAHLIQTSDHYRQLADQHQIYKKLVAELEGKAFPTEEEEAEEQRLKKLKLRLKDEMEAMVSEYRSEHLSAV